MGRDCGNLRLGRPGSGSLHGVAEAAVECAHLPQKLVVEQHSHWTPRSVMERLHGRHPSSKNPKETPCWQVKMLSVGELSVEKKKGRYLGDYEGNVVMLQLFYPGVLQGMRRKPGGADCRLADVELQGSWNRASQ